MSEEKKVFTKQDILDVMPQQPPFLFLDEVEICGDEAVGRYTISENEHILEGHFKGNPVFPGTIMLEALGQLGVFYLLKSGNPALKGKVDPSKIFFISADGARCSRICRPGDTLEIRARVTRLRHPISNFEASMTANGEKAAYAEKIALTFDYKS